MTDKTEQILGEESPETILTQDIRKLVRIKAAHRGAFSKPEKKVIPTLGRLIISQDHLFEADGLLSTFKKSQRVHRFEAGTELDIECEINLARDIATNLLFDEKVSGAIARCEALIAIYKVSMAATLIFSISVSIGKMRLPKLQVPIISFIGLYTDWRSFFDLFNASVDSASQALQGFTWTTG